MPCELGVIDDFLLKRLTYGNSGRRNEDVLIASATESIPNRGLTVGQGSSEDDHRPCTDAAVCHCAGGRIVICLRDVARGQTSWMCIVGVDSTQ